MRTLGILVAVVAAYGLAAALGLDLESRLLLAMGGYLFGLAIAQPRWLQIRYGWVQDEESNRSGAAFFAGVAGVLLAGFIGWRLVAIHRARGHCQGTVAAAAPGRDRNAALTDSVSLPLGETRRCRELLAE